MPSIRTKLPNFVSGLLLRPLKAWFASLQQRERVVVVSVFVVLVGVGIYISAVSLNQIIYDKLRISSARSQELITLRQQLAKYRVLQAQRDKVISRLDQANLTFEQVASETGAMVRRIIGSNNAAAKPGEKAGGSFQLRPIQQQSALPGERTQEDLEKQQFLLTVKGLSLEQLVALLYEFEKGAIPLFLGKLDVTRASDGTGLSATMEVISIRRKA